MSRTHLHDSKGLNIASGHRYKIRFVGGGGELYFADPYSAGGTPELKAGQPGSGSVFYIDDLNWPDKSQIQLRVDATMWGDSVPATGLYIGYRKFFTTHEAAEGYKNPSPDGGFYGVRGEKNAVFLGRSKSRGLRVNYGRGGGVQADLANGMLEVEFVRLPELEAEA